jgi:hypothetical protein
MINDLDSVAVTLESEIEAEEKRVGIRDPRHIRYSTLAKATIARRDNLKRTVSSLKDELAVATIQRCRKMGKNNTACQRSAVTCTDRLIAVALTFQY